MGQTATGTDPLEPINKHATDTEPYDSSKYDGANGGPVTTGQELNCDFEGPCCWHNDVGDDKDKLDYRVLNGGSVDGAVWAKVMSDPSVPKGKFIITGTKGGAESPTEAHFSSCAVKCAKNNVLVTYKYNTL